MSERLANQPEPRHAGGCQCGAVRYTIHGEIVRPGLCHCRMCQLAFGSYFAPLGEIAVGDLTWTRGAPKIYRSSSAAQRGFCQNCGTPLTFKYDREPEIISVSLGSLDDPAAVPPVVQDGIESRMPWFHQLQSLPGLTTEASTPAEILASIAQTEKPAGDKT
jgi:hypothetical protein